MKLQVLKQEDNYIKLRIEDEPYTLYNLLRHILAQRPDIKMVGFTKVETFSDVIEFQFETQSDASEEPLAIIEDAAKQVMAMSDEFIVAINDVFG